MTNKKPENAMAGQTSDSKTPFSMEAQVFQTLKEVWISLALFLVVGEILIGVLVGTFLLRNVSDPLMLKVTSMSGFALGILLAAAGFFHMAKKAGEIVDAGPGAALTVQRKGYLLRLGVFGAVLIIGYFSGWFQVLAILAGVLLLKPAIFLQPLVHKLIKGPDYDLDAPSLPYDEEEEEREALENELNGKFSWKRMLEFDYSETSPNTNSESNHDPITDSDLKDDSDSKDDNDLKDDNDSKTDIIPKSENE